MGIEKNYNIGSRSPKIAQTSKQKETGYSIHHYEKWWQ